jgi:malonate transporter and related proteins
MSACRLARRCSSSVAGVTAPEGSSPLRSAASGKQKESDSFGAVDEIRLDGERNCSAMLTVLGLSAPLFALVLLGLAIGRSGYLAAGADRLLAEFGFKVAMPALLFRATSSFAPLPTSPASLLLAYFSASAIVWVLATLGTRHILGRPPADAPVIAMATCFGNTVMLGIPLALIALGPEAATPAAILVAVDTPLLWVIATLHGEWSLRGRKGLSTNVMRDIAFELARNPIVLSVVLGALWRVTGLAMPGPVDAVIGLIAQAAVPTALVALGLTLARFRVQGKIRTLALIASFKLVLFPVLVLAITWWVIELSPIWAAIAILFAAMPTGANAYLFAVRSERVIDSVSGSLLITTALAAVTVSLLLYFGDWPASSG